MKTTNELIINKYNDFEPKCDTEYFKLNGQKGCLAVVVPFFNEEYSELKVTLKSLYYGYKYLKHMRYEWNNKEMKILIIQDGWYKSSNSMKEYLIQLFNQDNIINPNIIPWYEKMDFNDESVSKKVPTTYVFESNQLICVNREEIKAHHEAPIYMDITMIIKLDNRRKHNSHEWFIGKSGFTEKMESKYSLCTDAFTLFNKTCLYHLISYMDKHDNVCAATGRARVMTQKQQLSNETIWSMETLLRLVQLYDFEMSNVIYNGAFSLGGCLPVIPGPCGMYKTEYLLKDSVRDYYFSALNQKSNPNDVGIILGNLQLAEDRLLTYLSIFNSNQRDTRIAFVPMAIFYFEAELQLKRFLLQRRRWINGAMAGYIYLLFSNIKLITQWDTNKLRKLYVLILFGLQFLTSVIISVTPALAIKLFYFSVSYIMRIFGFNYTRINDISTLLTFCVWILFFVHYFIHYKQAYQRLVIKGLLIFSFITSFCMLISMFHVMYITGIKELFDGFISGTNIEVNLFFIVVILPLVNGLLSSGRFHSVGNIIKSFPAFYFFTPMLTAGFSSYSFTRTWDISWGNRPTEEKTTNLTRDQLEIIQTNLKSRSSILLKIIIVINIALFFAPIKYARYVIITFFIIVLYQMVFSFVYFVSLIPEKLRFLVDYTVKDVTLNDMINSDIEMLAAQIKEMEKLRKHGGNDEEINDEDEYDYQVSRDNFVTQIVEQKKCTDKRSLRSKSWNTNITTNTDNKISDIKSVTRTAAQSYNKGMSEGRTNIPTINVVNDYENSNEMKTISISTPMNVNTNLHNNSLSTKHNNYLNQRKSSRNNKFGGISPSLQSREYNESVVPPNSYDKSRNE